MFVKDYEVEDEGGEMGWEVRGVDGAAVGGLRRIRVHWIVSGRSHTTHTHPLKSFVGEWWKFY